MRNTPPIRDRPATVTCSECGDEIPAEIASKVNDEWVGTHRDGDCLRDAFRKIGRLAERVHEALLR